MLLAVFLILGILVFPMQLILLFRQNKWLVRILPALILILCILVGTFLALYPETFAAEGDDQLAAIIAVFLCAAMLILDLLAWFLFALVKVVQKRRK